MENKIKKDESSFSLKLIIFVVVLILIGLGWVDLINSDKAEYINFTLLSVVLIIVGLESYDKNKRLALFYFVL